MVSAYDTDGRTEDRVLMGQVGLRGARMKRTTLTKVG